MTSLINFAAINENFPVAGQDNDTQVFRDNFDTIKTNFRDAKTEIEDLQDNAARTDTTSDFNYNIVTTLTLQDAVVLKKDYGAAILSATQEVSFKQALYHVIRFGNNCSIDLIDFPVNEVDILGIASCGKAVLELYGDGFPVVTSGAFVPGTVYTINSIGTTNFITIGAATNTIGTVFTASGVGAGDGTAIQNRIITFTLPAGAQSKKSSNYPTTLTVGSTTNPVIVEVWRHRADKIFFNYLGLFS